jgi:hypothetical protein
MADAVTPEDFAKLQAMAEQATKTAEEAKTAAEARGTVKDAVVEEGEAQGIKVDEETATMIANVTIAQMEARGAFTPQGEVEPPPAPPADGSVPPTPAAVPPPVPVSPVEGEVPPASSVEEEQAPGKKSLAERFFG